MRLFVPINTCEPLKEGQARLASLFEGVSTFYGRKPGPLSLESPQSTRKRSRGHPGQQLCGQDHPSQTSPGILFAAGGQDPFLGYSLISGRPPHDPIPIPLKSVPEGRELFGPMSENPQSAFRDLLPRPEEGNMKDRLAMRFLASFPSLKERQKQKAETTCQADLS